jgi:hypothetical protein
MSSNPASSSGESAANSTFMLRFKRVLAVISVGCDIRRNRPPREERRVPRSRRSPRLSTSRQRMQVHHRDGGAWWRRRSCGNDRLLGLIGIRAADAADLIGALPQSLGDQERCRFGIARQSRPAGRGRASRHGRLPRRRLQWSPGSRSGRAGLAVVQRIASSQPRLPWRAT